MFIKPAYSETKLKIQQSLRRIRTHTVEEQEENDVILMLQLPDDPEDSRRIIWSRGGQRTLPNDRFRPYKSSLAIRQLTFDDAGHYSAESEDSYGTSMLASIDLTVQKRKPEVPIFLKRLHDVSVKIGSRARFLVEIESIPPLKITWYHDNQVLRKNERLNFLDEDRYYCLDVGWTLLQDEGHWTCIAENKHGCSVSSAYLTILVPKAYKAPRFVDELKAILAEDGTVSLECKVVGVPTPTLHWYKDGKKIKAGDTFALRANSADSSSLGTYSCVAKNCLGQAFSSSSVHVQSGGQLSKNSGTSAFLLGPQPKFVRELQNVEAQIETQLTLSCQVVVPPWPKTIDWYNKNGRVLENEKYKSMADGLGMYELEIKKVEMADEGEWKCVATSFFGIKAFTSCYVTVKFPKNYKTPKFLENLRAVMTPEGLVSFECKVIGYPTPQLKWLKDGRELKPGDVYLLTGTNSLGTYCCIAKNSMGEISSTTVLTLEDIQSQLTEEERLMIFAVNQPPYFVKGLSTHELQINDEFKFHVQVSAKPDPKIFWYRNDELIEKNERISMLKEEHGNFFLHLKRLELIDQAEWKAIAINDYGQSVTSCFVKLIVPKQFKGPRFLEELKATLTKEGTVNLECKVIGVPKPELRWYKDSKYLKPGEMHRILSGTNGTCRLGTYTCEALNCMGVASSCASLLAYEEDVQDLRKLRKSNTLDILSIITEERSSQLNNSDKSVTYEEAAGVSFSFDGKEVSISLYETPDLTEEEALQIVEMYANELTDHITDQNVVELPLLRFVKETVTSGNILMEATVIDVQPNELVHEDELKTDADIENSMMDDSAFLANSSIISEIDKNPPHRQSSQSLNEALLLRSSTESLLDSRNAFTNSPKASPSTLSLKTDTIDETSGAEHTAKRTVPTLHSPTCKRATMMQKRVSLDSEDDSLYEFEKRKAQKKLLSSAETQPAPTLEKIESVSAEDTAAALPDKKDLSVLESVALSISTMELDLDKIQNDLICSRDLKEDVTNYTLNVLCSLLQPVHEIKTSMETIESRLNDGDDDEREAILQTLCESITEFRNIVSELEKTKEHENDSVFHNRRQSILDAVVQPLNEIDKGLHLISADHLKRSTSSLRITEVEERSDRSSNDSSAGISISSDARKMIVILNEYNKELENLDVLIQQKRNSVQHDESMLKTLESLNSVVQQVKDVRDWSSTLHENSLESPVLGSERIEDILEFNSAVLQFLDTNINVVKAALQTSTGFSQINQFLDNTSSVRVNLETTLNLTSKLSPASAINYLVGALKTYTSISNQFPKNKALLQDVLVVNPDCIKTIDDSIEIILNSLETIEKCSQVENLYHKKRVLLALYRLKTPLQHLAITLRSVEKQILSREDEISAMTGLQVYTLVNVVSEPLQMVRKETNVILNDCHTQEHTHETIDILLGLVGPPLRDFQDAITAFHDIVFNKEPESIDANYVLSALNNLNPPLCEFANNMMKAEELILQDAPVVTDPRLGIRIVMQSVSSLIKTIFSLQADSPENHSLTAAISRLNEPLTVVKTSLKDINDRFYEEDPDKVNITMLKTLSTPFNLLQKQLIDTSNVLSGDIKNTITDLQRTILTIQDQVSFEYGDEPASIEYNIMTLQTLLQPLNVLRNHCVAIKEGLQNDAPPLTNVVDSLEKEQIKIINDIDHLLSELMKEPADQQYPPNLLKAINSTFHFLKKYKALLTTLKEPNSIQNATLSQNVRHVLQRMHSDFDKIEQNIESEELKYELEKIVSSVLCIEEARDLSSLRSSLQSLSSLTPVFSKILLELEVLSKVDITDVDSVECFIAFLQSLNTLRTLQDNVRNFQSSSNTDSIQIPMLLSFLGSCERLEIKVSELLSIVENCADRNVKLDSQFYKRAIESFTILNNQLIHLNKCLIDQSMSDDNQKEIPFEMSINAFTILLSTVVGTDVESDFSKEIQSIVQESIIDELKRLRNDILFNMSLIQSEDEITFNDSEQYEHNLPTSNPDLVGVCLKSIKDEVRKCNKYFDKMGKTQPEQKVNHIDNVNSSFENIYNILNFINRNVSLEGEELFIKTLREPVLHMLQHVHQIKVFSETSRADSALGLDAPCNILPMLNELNRSFENFKSLLVSEGTMSSSETSSSIAISHISPSNTQEFQPIKSDASEDMTDSIYNDLSSSTNTESVEYTTVKPNQVLDSSLSEAGSIDEKSIVVDSSSPSSDILSGDLKGLKGDTSEVSSHSKSVDETTNTINADAMNECQSDAGQNEYLQTAVCKTTIEEDKPLEKQTEELVTKTIEEDKVDSLKEEFSLLTNETSGYHSKATATDQSLCSTITANLEEEKHSIIEKENTNTIEELKLKKSMPTIAKFMESFEEVSEITAQHEDGEDIKRIENIEQELFGEAEILQPLDLDLNKSRNEDLDDIIETSSDDSGKTVVASEMLQATIQQLRIHEFETQDAEEGLQLPELREEFLQVESQTIAYEETDSQNTVVVQETTILHTKSSENESISMNKEEELNEEQIIVKVEFPEENESPLRTNTGSEVQISEIVEPCSVAIQNQDLVNKDTIKRPGSVMEIVNTPIQEDITREYEQQISNKMDSHLLKLAIEEFVGDITESLSMVDLQRPQTATQGESDIERAEMVMKDFNTCIQAVNTMITDLPQTIKVEELETADAFEETEGESKIVKIQEILEIENSNEDKSDENGMVSHEITLNVKDEQISQEDLETKIFIEKFSSGIQEGAANEFEIEKWIPNFEEFTDTIESQCTSLDDRDQKFETAISNRENTVIETTEKMSVGVTVHELVGEMENKQLETGTLEYGKYTIEPQSEDQFVKMQYMKIKVVDKITDSDEHFLSEKDTKLSNEIEDNYPEIEIEPQEIIEARTIDQDQDFEKQGSVIEETGNILMTATNDQNTEEGVSTQQTATVEEIYNDEQNGITATVLNTDKNSEKMGPSLIRGNTTEEYWDTKDDEYFSECSKKQYEVSCSTLSEQESFETAMDDMENSHCDELGDWENISFDKDSHVESLKFTQQLEDKNLKPDIHESELEVDNNGMVFPSTAFINDQFGTQKMKVDTEEWVKNVLNEPNEEAEISSYLLGAEKESYDFTKPEMFLDNNVHIELSTLGLDEYAIPNKEEINTDTFDIEEKIEINREEAVLAKEVIGTGTNEVFKCEAATPEVELIKSLTRAETVENEEQLVKTEIIESGDIHDKRENVEIKSEASQIAVIQKELDNQNHLIVEEFSKAGESSKFQNSTTENQDDEMESPLNELEKTVSNGISNLLENQDSEIKSQRAQQELNKAVQTVDEVTLEREEKVKSKNVDNEKLVSEIEVQEINNIESELKLAKIDNSDTLNQSAIEEMEKGKLELKDETWEATNTLIMNIVKTPEHQNAIEEEISQDDAGLKTDILHDVTEENTNIQCKNIKTILQGPKVDEVIQMCVPEPSLATKENLEEEGPESITEEKGKTIDLGIENILTDNDIDEADIKKVPQEKLKLEIKHCENTNEFSTTEDSTMPQNAISEENETQGNKSQVETIDKAIAEEMQVVSEPFQTENHIPESPISEKYLAPLSQKSNIENLCQELSIGDIQKKDESNLKVEELKIENLNNDFAAEIMGSLVFQKSAERTIPSEDREMLEGSTETLKAPMHQNAGNIKVEETKFQVQVLNDEDLKVKEVIQEHISGMDGNSLKSDEEDLRKVSLLEDMKTDQELEFNNKIEKLEIENSDKNTTLMEVNESEMLQKVDMENASIEKLTLEEESLEVTTEFVKTKEAQEQQNAVMGEIEIQEIEFQTEKPMQASIKEDEVINESLKVNNLEIKTEISEMEYIPQKFDEPGFRQESSLQDAIQQKTHELVWKKEELKVGILDNNTTFPGIRESEIPERGEIENVPVEKLEFKDKHLEVSIEFSKIKETLEHQNATMGSIDAIVGEYQIVTLDQASAEEGSVKHELLQAQIIEINDVLQKSNIEDLSKESFPENEMKVEAFGLNKQLQNELSNAEYQILQTPDSNKLKEEKLEGESATFMEEKDNKTEQTDSNTSSRDLEKSKATGKNLATEEGQELPTSKESIIQEEEKVILDDIQKNTSDYCTANDKKVLLVDAEEIGLESINIIKNLETVRKENIVEELELEENVIQDSNQLPKIIETTKQCPEQNITMNEKGYSGDIKINPEIQELELQINTYKTNVHKLQIEKCLEPMNGVENVSPIKRVELENAKIDLQEKKLKTEELQPAQIAKIEKLQIEKVELRTGKLHIEAKTSNIEPMEIIPPSIAKISQIEKLELIKEKLIVRTDKTKIVEPELCQTAIIEDSKMEIAKLKVEYMDAKLQTVNIRELETPVWDRAKIVGEETTEQGFEVSQVEKLEINHKPEQAEMKDREDKGRNDESIKNATVKKSEEEVELSTRNKESANSQNEPPKENIKKDTQTHENQLGIEESISNIITNNPRILENNASVTELNIDLYLSEDLILSPVQTETSLANANEMINQTQEYEEKVQKSITQAYVQENELNVEDSLIGIQDLQIETVQCENVAANDIENSVTHKVHTDIAFSMVKEQQIDSEMLQTKELPINKTRGEKVLIKETEDQLIGSKLEKNIVFSHVEEESLNIQEEFIGNIEEMTASHEQSEQGALKETENLIEDCSAIKLEEKVEIIMNSQAENNLCQESGWRIEEESKQVAENVKPCVPPVNMGEEKHKLEEENQIETIIKSKNLLESIKELESDEKTTLEITVEPKIKEESEMIKMEFETPSITKLFNIQENPSVGAEKHPIEEQQNISIESTSAKSEEKSEEIIGNETRNLSKSIKRRKSSKKKLSEKKKVNELERGEGIQETSLEKSSELKSKESTAKMEDEIGTSKTVQTNGSLNEDSQEKFEHSLKVELKLNKLEKPDLKHQMFSGESVDSSAIDGKSVDANGEKGIKKLNKEEVEQEISLARGQHDVKNKILNSNEKNDHKISHTEEKQSIIREFETFEDFKKPHVTPVGRNFEITRYLNDSDLGRQLRVNQDTVLEITAHENRKANSYKQGTELQDTENFTLNRYHPLYAESGEIPKSRYCIKDVEFENLSKAHKNNYAKTHQGSDYYSEYYKYSQKVDLNDIPRVKLSHNLNFPTDFEAQFSHNQSDFNNRYRWHSRIPEVKISQIDKWRATSLESNDKISGFLGPDYSCSRASSVDRSSRASSISRDYNNEHSNLPIHRQRYSTTTSDDFDIEYRPVSAPPYLPYNAHQNSRPISPMCDSSFSHRKLPIRDDIHLDYNYLRGHCYKSEFKHIPSYNRVPRHHMYLHLNYYHLQNSSFSYEFYHPNCPYCRILYLRYRTNNWSDYLQRGKYSDSIRRNCYRPQSWDSNISLSSRMKGYQSDEDVLDHVHSKTAGTDQTRSRWASDSDFRKTIPSNSGISRSKEAEDLLSKHFWDDKHPTHVYFSDNYTRIHRPSFFQGDGSNNRIPRTNFNTTLSPRLKQLYAEDTVPVGATVTLHVEVEGTPKPNIEWLREERKVLPVPTRYRYLEDTDLHTLVISDISYNDAGRYRCKVWNKYGVADAYTSINVVAASRGKPPRFISRPETIMCVSYGSDVSVSFRMSGDPKPRVSWMKGLTDITETQRSLRETVNDYIRLTLKRAQISDAGTYFIIIKNKYGTDRAFFTLRVNQRSRSLTPVPSTYKYELTQPPRTSSAERTSNVYNKVPGPVPDEPWVTEFGKHYLTLSWRKPLRCEGAPIMAYRVEKWLVGETEAGQWMKVGMTPTTTLDVYNLNPGERYDFRVTARNQYGWGEPTKTGTPITFDNITEFPEFERCLPGELKVLSDTTAELECQVKHDKEVEIEWSKDGKTISDDNKYEIMYRDGRCRLIIQNLNDEDSGRYVCEATNEHGKVCTFVRLMVVHDQRIVNAILRLNRLRQESDGKIDMAPLFSMRLRNRRIQICYPVRLTCQVRGYPRPSVVWYRDGNRIEENQYFSIHEEADDFHSIEINNTKPEHSGTYSIVASNSSGTVSCKCELVVDEGLRTYIGPKFVDKLDTVYSVQEGSQLRLRAVVCAYPAAEITWRKNDVCLRQSRRIIVTVSHEGEVELTVARMKQQDSGIYTCMAINEVGSAETNTRIEVYPKQRASESEKKPEESDAL